MSTRTYTAWEYLYPPRPESAITPDMIGYYAKRGWVGQYKKNGTLAIIGIGPGCGMMWYNRHDDPLKWTPTEQSVKGMRHIFGDHSWTVLVAELLHHKHRDVKNTIYIFDTIVWEGQLLIGRTFAERQDLLHTRFQPFATDDAYSHIVGPGGLWLAKLIPPDQLEAAFFGIETPELDEGLVLKLPSAELQDGMEKQGHNQSWQVKVRYPKKNYSF